MMTKNIILIIAVGFIIGCDYSLPKKSIQNESPVSFSVAYEYREKLKLLSIEFVEDTTIIHNSVICFQNNLNCTYPEQKHVENMVYRHNCQDYYPKYEMQINDTICVNKILLNGDNWDTSGFNILINIFLDMSVQGRDIMDNMLWSTLLENPIQKIQKNDNLMTLDSTIYPYDLDLDIYADTINQKSIRLSYIGQSDQKELFVLSDSSSFEMKFNISSIPELDDDRTSFGWAKYKSINNIKM